MTESRTVSGRVRLREAISSPGAILRVKLEDVSRADAAAKLIVEAVVPIAQALQAGAELPFLLAVPNFDERVHYNVRAHVDMTGSGEVSSGDRVSTVACPVLTWGSPDEVTVEAKAI